MKRTFLTSKLFNIILTIVILSLPLIRESVKLPTGGYQVFYYRPISLLPTFIQKPDFYLLAVMIVFTFGIYFIVSVVTNYLSKLLKI